MRLSKRGWMRVALFAGVTCFVACMRDGHSLSLADASGPPVAPTIDRGPGIDPNDGDPIQDDEPLPDDGDPGTDPGDGGTHDDGEDSDPGGPPGQDNTDPDRDLPPVGPNDQAPVPEPATFLLLGGGLAALVAARRKLKA